MRHEIGIDPGLHGAWAILDDKGGLVAADNFPLGADGEIDALALWQTWEPFEIARATVERVGLMSTGKNGQRLGMQGRFNFGRRYGSVLTVLQILGIPVDLVDPAVWKRACGVTADKDTSLAAARQLWPAHAATTFKLKKHVDRAEAALIGRYGQRVSRRRAA